MSPPTLSLLPALFTALVSLNKGIKRQKINFEKKQETNPKCRKLQFLQCPLEAGFKKTRKPIFKGKFKIVSINSFCLTRLFICKILQTVLMYFFNLICFGQQFGIFMQNLGHGWLRPTGRSPFARHQDSTLNSTCRFLDSVLEFLDKSKLAGVSIWDYIYVSQSEVPNTPKYDPVGTLQALFPDAVLNPIVSMYGSSYITKVNWRWSLRLWVLDSRPLYSSKPTCQMRVDWN